MTRRRWIAATAAAAVAGVGIDALAIEPGSLAITRHRIGTPGGSLLRIAQVTDLHLRAIDGHTERVAAAVTGLEPDLVVLTGDAIDRAGSLPVLDAFLHLIGTATPKLAILGNWEHWGHVDLARLRALYERRNCQLLVNESTVVPTGVAHLLVTGLDDLVGGQPDVRRALAGAHPCTNHLLLAHCPMHRDRFRSDARAQSALPGSPVREIDVRLLNPEVMLAGHTHGGQIAPFGWAPLRPRGSGRYVSGWYRDDPTALYVSRGIGTSVVRARFGAPPELSVFEWSLAAS